MSTEGKSSPKKRLDSQMEPQKTVEEDDSGLGTSKSQTPSSGMTSGEAHDHRKVGQAAPGQAAPGPSSAKSPAKKSARSRSRVQSPTKKSAVPGTLEKSPLKRAGKFFRSSSPKPPKQGASPKKIAARTSGDVQKRTALVETDPETGLARQVQIFENPPPPDRSPSPPVRRYPTRQAAKKKGREKY
ncbi:uncharacterized protein LOC119402504 [Rhipicephalus sanguineus]|uniref:uncharacterized protein LOC119402504 n=1 Tax=Rhipicephalus sanguineus TaxID=34632 RepID=UPI001895A011|nr:uncharacterized protein LOC119402504 [Rhipicephalus sanguineus]